MSKYVIEARLPSGETIRGARTHSSMKSVKEQLVKTAPQWRAVFPGIEFQIESVNGHKR